jgi:hypothetical protein
MVKIGADLQPLNKGLGKAGGMLKSAVAPIAKIATGLALGAVAGIGAVGGAITKLAMDAAQIEPIRRDFERLSESIGESTNAMIEGMRKASSGMVADSDLMLSANRLISMGLAESAEEASNLTHMAVRLGEAMGKGPTQAMEEFALMMANQSIPRLDTFGISAGKVRERMAELMGAAEKGGMTQADLSTAIGKSGTKLQDLQNQLALATLRQSEYTDKTKESTRVAGQMRIDKLNRQIAEQQAALGKLNNTIVSTASATKALSREEAFAQAVRELGAESLERIGEGGKGAAATMARLQASFKNIKNEIGQAFIPILDALLTPLSELAQKHGPQVVEWARQFSEWLRIRLIPNVLDFGKKIVIVIREKVIPTFQAIIKAIPWGQILDVLGKVTEGIGLVGGAILGLIGKIPGLQGLLDKIPWGGLNTETANAAKGFDAIGAAADKAATRKFNLDEFFTGGEKLTETQNSIRETQSALQELADEIAMLTLDDALTKLAAAMEEPEKTGLNAFLVNHLLPNLEAWGGLLGAIWDKGVELDLLLKGRVKNAIKTGLVDPIHNFLSDQGRRFGETIEKWRIRLADFFIPKVELLKGAIDLLAGAFDWATERLNALKDAVRNWKPADLITPGSPSPMEKALRGIADAAYEASAAIGGMGGIGMPPSGFGGLTPTTAMAGAGGGSPTIIVVNLDRRDFEGPDGELDYGAIGQQVMGGRLY